MEPIFLSSIASCVSAATACIAVGITCRVVERDKKSRLMDVHKRFQEEMRTIQRGFPVEVNEEDWYPKTPENSRLLSLYWYLVFDEWLICVKGDPSLKQLWNSYYKKGVMSALRKKAFKEKIEKIFEGESSFFGHGEEFKNEIDAICQSLHGRKLKVV